MNEKFELPNILQNKYNHFLLHLYYLQIVFKEQNYLN